MHLKIRSLLVLVTFVGSSVTGFVHPSSAIHSFSTLEDKTTSKVVLFDTEDARREILEVPYGEDSRKYRRSVFNAELWLNHRSPDRFFKNLSNIFVSGIARQLIPEVVTVTSVAVIVCFWNAMFIDGFCDGSGIHHDPLIAFPPSLELALPTAPFQMSTAALGLLLGKSLQQHLLPLYIL